MTRTIGQLQRVDRVLPSRSGRVCRVLCLVVVGACATDPDPTCDPARSFRITSVSIPKNATEARTFALDLDGDDQLDNSAGMVSGALHGQILGFDLSTAA